MVTKCKEHTTHFDRSNSHQRKTRDEKLPHKKGTDTTKNQKRPHGAGRDLLEAKSPGVQPFRLPCHALVSTQCSNGEYPSNRNIKQEPLPNMATVYSAIRRDPLHSTRWTLNNVRREDPQRQRIQKRTTGCNGEGKRGKCILPWHSSQVPSP